MAMVVPLALVAASCDTLKARREASQAATLYKEGDIQAATARYTEAEKLDPGIATIHLNLGFGHLSLFQAAPKGPKAGEHAAAAVAEFRKYLEMKPDDPRGRNYLIQTFVDTKRYDDAVDFFKPEVEANPPSLEAIGVLGQIAAKVGRFDAALSWYQKRMDVAPKDPDGYTGMGVIVWDHLHNHAEVTGEQRRQFADRAITALKKAIEMHPGPPEPYTYVNLLYRERASSFLCPTVSPDAGAPPVAAPGAAPTDGGVDPAAECNAAKAADLAEADKYLRIALEKIKAAQGLPKPGEKAPEKPGDKPAPAAPAKGGH